MFGHKLERGQFFQKLFFSIRFYTENRCSNENVEIIEVVNLLLVSHQKLYVVAVSDEIKPLGFRYQSAGFCW